MWHVCTKNEYGSGWTLRGLYATKRGAEQVAMQLTLQGWIVRVAKKERS